MGAHQASVDFEPGIWARLIGAPKAPISRDAAQYLLSIDFSETDHARMQELMDKSNEGVLSPDETAELDGYLKAGPDHGVAQQMSQPPCVRWICLMPFAAFYILRVRQHHGQTIVAKFWYGSQHRAPDEGRSGNLVGDDWSTGRAIVGLFVHGLTA